EAGLQALGRLECAPVPADVFAQAEDTGIALHFLDEPFPDRLQVGHLSHDAAPGTIAAASPEGRRRRPPAHRLARAVVIARPDRLPDQSRLAPGRRSPPARPRVPRTRRRAAPR